MIHTATDIVELVTDGLTRQSRGYLILVPPGFDRSPDIGSQIDTAIRASGNRRVELITVSADSVASDEDLVDLLIHEWCTSDASTGERWLGIEEEVGGVPPQQRLKAFWQFALVGVALRVLVIRRFDKVFRNMSGALLAVLRDLEHTRRLTAINTSVLSYTELYQRRALHDPSFVSDYGQSHAILTLGPVDDAEAEHEWEQSVDSAMEQRLSRAYRTTALEISGRVPNLFTKAAAYAAALREERDVRRYDRLLRRELAPEFRRLIRYDDSDDSAVPALAESIARVHWGIGSHSDVKLILGHRWGELLIRTARGEPTLVSRALGECAVDMLGRVPRRMSAELLYERGEYQACVDQLRSLSSERRDLLEIAAEMLSVALEDPADPLYFAAEVNWRQVETLAREAMNACGEPSAAEQFRGWVQVAEAMNASGSDPELLLRKDLVRIGLRVLAVRADTNAVTSAYSAIPLVEDAVKTYVVRIHGVEPKGLAFADVVEEEVATWWNRGPFSPPGEDARLSGASLVVLAAVLSARTGTRLFQDAADAMNVVNRLDQHRNPLGHRVDTPDRTVGAALADCAERILDASAQQGHIDLSVQKLGHWVRIPQAFLAGR